MNFWQGKNIRLRAIEPSDAEYFAKWNLDSERSAHLAFVWPPTSASSMMAWASDQSKRKLENDTFFWVIENMFGEPVGSISTHDCNPRDGTFSYGVDVAAEHRRKGYASEAIKIVLKYYFEELRYQKVTVPVHSDNPASIAMHKKLGSKKEGTHRRMAFSHGKYIDIIWFGMTKEEFESIRE